LFVHSMSEIFLPNAGSSSIPGDQGGWRKRELNP
jgi:hypothetical protein